MDTRTNFVCDLCPGQVKRVYLYQSSLKKHMQLKHKSAYNTYIAKMKAREDPNSRGIHFKSYTPEELKMNEHLNQKSPVKFPPLKTSDITTAELLTGQS